MTIAHLLQSRSGAVHTCTADTRIAGVVAVLARQRIGALPVIEHGTVIGIISERDIVSRLNDLGPGLMEARADEVMSGSPVTVEPRTSVLAALSLMTQRRIRHLPVIEAGTMTGFVSIGDLVKYRIDHIEAEAEAMRSYIQTA